MQLSEVLDTHESKSGGRVVVGKAPLTNNSLLKYLLTIEVYDEINEKHSSLE
jgi:hypothetical protein